jgi:hypothetical protein
LLGSKSRSIVNVEESEPCGMRIENFAVQKEKVSMLGDSQQRKCNALAPILYQDLFSGTRNRNATIGYKELRGTQVGGHSQRKIGKIRKFQYRIMAVKALIDRRGVSRDSTLILRYRAYLRRQQI